MTEWKTIKLGDVCEVVRGGSPRPIIDYITDQKDGVNWLKIGDVKETDKYFTHANEKIKPEGIPKTREVKRGDLILSNSMSFGRAFITLIDGYIHDGWLRLRCDEKVLNKEYLYYYLTSSLAQNQFKAVATGSVVNNLKSDTVKAIDLLLPSLKEQEKIVSILTTIDDKIVENNRINDNLLQQCTTLYEEICLTADFALMSDLVAVVETGSRPKGGAQLSGIPSIGAEKIERFGTYDYSGEKFISEEYFSKLKRGVITSGDVLLYKDGAYTGKSSMALDGFPHVRCAVNEHVFIIRTANKKYQYFLYFTLQNDDIHKKIYGLACGKAAQPGLNQPELLSVSIKLPSTEVLETFEDQVNPLMHQIALNALESKRLSDLRDAILPRLMSGELDVSKLDLD